MNEKVNKERESHGGKSITLIYFEQFWQIMHASEFTLLLFSWTLVYLQKTNGMVITTVLCCFWETNVPYLWCLFSLSLGPVLASLMHYHFHSLQECNVCLFVRYTSSDICVWTVRFYFKKILLFFIIKNKFYKNIFQNNASFFIFI